MRVAELLRHLYVLLPVLDGKKHYYISDDEVSKLLRHGEGWLETHPQREMITQRFLKYRKLVQQVGEQWPAWEEEDAPDAQAEAHPPAVRPHDDRLNRVAEKLRQSGVSSVIDLGCGEGKLLQRLLTMPQFRELAGLDLSARSLDIAADKLKLRERPELRERVRLLHGSLSYPDSRLKGFDAAALVEVIEHLEPHRLEALSENVFGFARPGLVLLTTPNAEYNASFAEPKALRHADHRFEWTRAEFEGWARSTAEKYGYGVEFEALGDIHPEYGPMTQMAVFVRGAG